MANAKESSAAQRREQMRQQRTHRDEQIMQKQQAKNRTVRKAVGKGINPWWYIGGVLVVLTGVVVYFIYLANQQAKITTTATTDIGVLQQVTHVSPTLLAQVGTADVKNPFQAVRKQQPLLLGPTGKPEFLYYGAEFCPYCAGERWGVVVALSRFGTFTKLPEVASAPNDTPPSVATFSFYKSSYTSKYVDFVSYEAQDVQGKVLETPPTAQQKIIDTYDAPPYTANSGYPFIDVGNQYVTVGPTYLPDVLAGMSQQNIAAQLTSPDNDVSRNIMATANYLTASLCSVTNNQPTSVCSDASIQKIVQTMPKSVTTSTGTAPLATISSPSDILMPLRRRA